MQFIDLKAQQKYIRLDLEGRLAALLDHGQYILGPEIQEMEEVLANYVGVKHCVSVASGTDALMLALMALEIGRGDEVITSAYSFFASAGAIAVVGARPVFVDIDPLVLTRLRKSRRKAVTIDGLDASDIDVEQIKWVVLMVLFSQPGQELAQLRVTTHRLRVRVGGAAHAAGSGPAGEPVEAAHQADQRYAGIVHR